MRELEYRLELLPKAQLSIDNVLEHIIEEYDMPGAAARTKVSPISGA
jgi:hypothetical protein